MSTRTVPARPATQRVLTTRELNRALLARQLLLERADVSLVEGLERVAGLQAQYAPSAYVGLWARLKAFRRDALTEALEAKDVVEATLLRSTIHVVSARDFGLFAAGIRTARREGWLRVTRKELDGVDMAAVAARVRVHLADGPRRRTELVELLAADGYPARAWDGAGLWIDMVRVPPSGTWERRRADLYGLADHWLGPSRVAEIDGIEHLVRRYLDGFGPASLNDVANWAGVPVTTLRPVADRLDLVRYRDERGTLLLDLPDRPLPDAGTRAPVRLLPTWDATLLVHARRARILPEEYRPRIFHTKNPQSVPTFLVDGAVAGTWRYEGGHVTTEPFERLAPVTRRELEDETARLAAFHSA
jgi:hypothetical protein